MTRFIVNEMICDNRVQLHTMKRPRVFKTEEAAHVYVMERVSTEYTKEKGYKVKEVRGWDNGEGKLTTVFYNGGFSEFCIYREDIR